MDPVIDLVSRVLSDVIGTVARTWPFVLISIVAAAAITTYVGTERLEALLRRRRWAGIAGAVALATLTPFCSCGTTAVLLGGLAAAAPWGPLVAFLVASPLTSPSELFLSAGLFGWQFALIFFFGTMVIGVGAGAVATWAEGKGWLAGQARMARDDAGCSSGACSSPAMPSPASIGPGAASILELRPARPGLAEFGREIIRTARKLVPLFLAFTFIGYLVIEAIPTEWVTQYLGGESALAVPAAAALGIPAYISTEGSLPLVAAMMDGGMSSGAALAFLVTGAGTSLGAISGLLVIARRRVVGLVISSLVVSAIALGLIGGAVL